MLDYIAELAALTEEEQAIYRLDWIGPGEQQRLEKIGQARELLWNAERARKAKAPLTEVPIAGWKVDQIGGYKSPRPRQPPKERAKPPTERVRELPKGVERNQSGRVRAVCFLRDRSKITFGTFDNTPEQIALAGRMAEAARKMRDAGGSSGEVRAAALAVYQERERQVSYAAD